MPGIPVFKARTCLMSQVRSKRNRNGDAARAYGDGQSQRIKRMLQGIFKGSRSLLCRRRSDLLVKQTPARRRHDQPAGDLDDGQVTPKNERISLPNRNEPASKANPYAAIFR